MGKLLVRRRAFNTKRGTRVQATTFRIRDLGRPGRGPKVIPKLRKGRLGVDFSKSARSRRRREVMVAKRLGEKSVLGMLQAIVVFNKRVNPVVSRKAASDRRFIASSFIGKRRVRTGTGLTR